MLNSSCDQYFLNQVYFKTIIGYQIYPKVYENVATCRKYYGVEKNINRKFENILIFLPSSMRWTFTCTIILRTILLHANPARSSEKWNTSNTSKTPLCIILFCSYYSIAIFKCCVYNNITICYNISSRYTIVKVEI